MQFILRILMFYFFFFELFTFGGMIFQKINDLSLKIRGFTFRFLDFPFFGGWFFQKGTIYPSKFGVLLFAIWIFHFLRDDFLKIGYIYYIFGPDFMKVAIYPSKFEVLLFVLRIFHFWRDEKFKCNSNTCDWTFFNNRKINEKQMVYDKGLIYTIFTIILSNKTFPKLFFESEIWTFLKMSKNGFPKKVLNFRCKTRCLTIYVWFTFLEISFCYDIFFRRWVKKCCEWYYQWYLFCKIFRPKNACFMFII